ncbi:LuxR C-terminal-related transcriptional regulator [Kibdelosporangium philippinense]|uniref:LuxR C-terminal-related transcriptional regulator n=1 Tax=Kibdelosporangium philippinense TaxID=211113 RepID=A0ABS8ZV71_9PSEU|nr:LuxR family transcriptional regulator [Kibdelosporangium philippinense]MCE7011601.1 LuxR C-terminal-related transcriptional regulator [Kibdelosporangium philippinense]
MNALWKDGLTSRVGLAELPADAVDQLLDHAFGDRLAPVSRRQLHRVSAGNPLLLREILLAGLDTGELRHRHGAWRWTGEVRATTRLAEVVAARLGSVPDTVYAALEVVAGGEPVPLALLERLVGAEAVATAGRKGLVTTESTGRRLVAQLSHPLYGEVIRSTMAASRARSVAGQLADAMTSTAMRRRDDALRVGTFQSQSGRTGDPAILLEAAKQAKDRFDHELAERLARWAHDSGAGWAAEQLLAEVLLDHGRYEELTVPGSPGAGAVAKARGELDVAAASFREVLALMPNYDTFRLAATCLAELAGARALAGDHRQARRLLDRADAHTSRLFQPWIELNRAWAYAASGEISRAAAHARDTAEAARGNGLPTTEALALYDVARLGEPRTVYIRLSELATELTCDVGTALADAACALVDNDHVRLTRAADGFERLGMLLHAAEALVTAARMAHEAGAHTRATAATSRANNLMRLLPKARTPMLATTGLPAMLTPREREVALLAAQGQSSRWIAARLHLSVRTVDNYLGRAYAKLGVTSRTELGPLLSPQAPE